MSHRPGTPIVFGVLSFTFLRLVAGRWREVSPTVAVLSALFLVHLWLR
ncbi:MAG: hypothetical protein WDA75_04735 [Candidatus Latescibacterota bacterium]